MLKDFNKLKRELKELSAVLNTFKSEAVQLKIVELLFQDVPSREVGSYNVQQGLAAPGERKRGRPRKIQTGGPVKIVKKRTRSKFGPTTVLRQLMKEDFFNTKRPIGDIVKYSNEKMNLPLKSNDFSGILMNYIRSKQLRREKNPETGQYEYMNP